MNTDVERKSYGSRDLPRRQVVITMAGVMLALFFASLDQTVVGTALPRIITDLGGFTQYTWVATAYLIASTVTLLIAGKLSDMYGRKWFIVGGIAVFIVGSILCGTSQTMNQLIIFRALQGIGAGAIMGMAFIIVADLFPPAERGKYVGFLSGVFGLSSVIGPTLGGYITDNLSWNWVFFINIPFGVLIILLLTFFFPHVRPGLRKHRVDYAGMMTLVLTVVPFMLALTWAGVEYEWLSFPILFTFGFSAVMLLLFIIVESRAKEPILPLWIFRNRIVSVASIVTFILGFGMFTGIIFIPLYFQGVLGSSATASGSFLTPMMLGVVVGSIISGQVLSRAGGHYRIQGAVGIILMGLGLFLLSGMTVETSYATAVMNIIIVGLGLGITMPVYVIAIQNAVPYTIMGVATSTNTFFRSIGGAFGLAIAGSIMNNRFADEFMGGLPPEISEVVPSEQLSSLVNNPQALVSPEAQDQLSSFFQSMGSQGLQLFEQLLITLREALNSALAEVFFIAFCAVAVAFFVNLFIKEVPLRKHL
jgi:EmrB/QacA subfamily drug resistance transporter